MAKEICNDCGSVKGVKHKCGVKKNKATRPRGAKEIKAIKPDDKKNHTNIESLKIAKAVKKTFKPSNLDSVDIEHSLVKVIKLDGVRKSAMDVAMIEIKLSSGKSFRIKLEEIEGIEALIITKQGDDISGIIIQPLVSNQIIIK